MLYDCSPCGRPQPQIRSSTVVGSTSGFRSSSASTTNAPRSSGRIPVSEPLKARPIGLRMASTMTASGMRKVSLSRYGGAPMLRNQHEFSVRRVLLATPGFSGPVKRKRLPFDFQIARRGELEQAVVGRLGLVARDVAEREAHDRERLSADVARAQRRLRTGRL